MIGAKVVPDEACSVDELYGCEIGLSVHKRTFVIDWPYINAKNPGWFETILKMTELRLVTIQEIVKFW